MASSLSRLIDDDAVAIAVPVRLELLAGAGKAHAALLSRLLKAVPTFMTSAATWDVVEEWVIKAGRKGEHFGIGDLVIAAIAYEHECPVWSLDSDFTRLAALGCGKRYDSESI